MMLVFADNPKREYAYGPAGGLPDSKVVPFSQTFYVEAVQGLDRHQHEEGQVSREKTMKRQFETVKPAGCEALATA